MGLLLVSLGGCGGAPVETGPWEGERTVAGDTVVVRTLSGSEWGREARLRAVRELEPGAGGFRDVKGLALGRDGEAVVYDARRRLLSIFPGDGGAPALVGGEREPVESDGGVAVAADGTVLVRLGTAGVIGRYSASGARLGEWPLPSDVQTDLPLYQDTSGQIYTLTWLRAQEESRGGSSGLGGEARREALLRYSTAGALTDSVPVPELPSPPADLSAARGGLRMSVPLPFVPLPVWTFSPEGYFVTSPGDPYRVELRIAADSVIRIERRAEPVPIEAEEQERESARITSEFRAYFPDWSWPDSLALRRVKPAIQGVVVGRDGRIWVQRSAPVVESAGEWTEPVVYDVFRPDGAYLGVVHTPDGFRASPPPAIAGDRLLAVVERDGRQRVVLFEIDR